MNNNRQLASKNGGFTITAAIIGVAIIIVIALSAVVVWHHHNAKVKNTGLGSSQQQQAADQRQNQNPTTSDGSLASGSNSYTIESGGRERTYRVYKPAGISGQVPLVVMIHGGGGSGAVAEKFYGWDAQADQHKFIVAYPDGLGPNVPAWNVDGGGCCGYSARNNVNDVQFITDMVSKIKSQADIDKNRIYASGISNGGILDYTLACQTNIFAAIGPDSATMLNACPSPSPISVIHVHGLEDTAIKFNGGPGQGSGDIDGPSVPSVIASWQKADSCSAPSSTTSGVVVTEIATCLDNRSVELVTIANGGHGWPGSPAKSAQSTSGGTLPSQAIDATSVIWQFFASHPKQ